MLYTQQEEERIQTALSKVALFAKEIRFESLTEVHWRLFAMPASTIRRDADGKTKKRHWAPACAGATAREAMRIEPNNNAQRPRIGFILSQEKFDSRSAVQEAKHSNMSILRAFATPKCTRKSDLSQCSIMGRGPSLRALVVPEYKQ